jgi:Ni/Co efflux regulator RcnB
MKMKMAALGVMLLASVSTVALAQDGRGERGGDRGARSEGRMERGPRSSVPAARPAPSAREPSAPRQAPAAARAMEGRGGGEWRGDRNRGGERQPGARPGGWAGNDGDRRARPPMERTDRGERADRPDGRDGRRFENRQGSRDGRPEGWRPDTPRPDNARPDNGRRDGWRGDDRRGDDRRFDSRRGDNRNDYRRDERRWSGGGPRPNHPRWEPRRYPNMYQSRQRYRLGAYYPPAGFSLRMWSYGDYMPRAWYTESYRLMDWWAYDLPMPPPGYEWIRSGSDALLVDTFNGMVVQVVRYVFW